MKKPILTALLSILISLSFATTWHIGPTHTYTLPSQVSTLVADGDTIEIDYGIYNSDVARWTANNLVIRGLGGYAHLKANGNSYGGKAIWVIAGNNNRIENIEFSLCSVPDQNGAGIRQEGHNLFVSHCYFHDNENGILAGTVSPSNITIQYSEFANNGFGDGQSHNLYVNNIDTLVFKYNYSHHAIVGHELKSRAHVNFILYNRISDEETGSASRSIDLPNGGTTYLIGNVIEQGPLSQNSNIVGFGLEGLSNPSPHEFCAINNTLVNDHTSGSFFSFQTGTDLFKAYNNIIAGAGSFMTSNNPDSIDMTANLVDADISVFNFKDAQHFDYHLTDSSFIALDQGVDPGIVNTFDLYPFAEYVHPNIAVIRCINGPLDIGAFEYCSSVGIIDKDIVKPLIFPNPVKDFITISLPGSGLFNVEIYSTTGQLVIQKSNTYSIDLNGQKRGLYLIKIKQGNTLLRCKIVKE